jgi:O-antigen biosynthesis protein WbqP
VSAGNASKRAFDVVASAAALLVLSPVMLGVALAIRLEDGGPALFRQTRVGKDGQPFRIFKFRSMPVATPDVPSAGARTLTVTRVGRFIRRTNLDELPQLLNILRGDMSVVGPRPALPAQRALVDLRTELGALACRPGLTGLAQIRSYDGMPEEEKAQLDAAYARSASLSTDLGIIARTFGYLARRPPVY